MGNGKELQVDRSPVPLRARAKLLGFFVLRTAKHRALLHIGKGAVKTRGEDKEISDGEVGGFCEGVQTTVQHHWRDAENRFGWDSHVTMMMEF